eukprot:762702-Hanusia_phi.AAC.2
MLFQRHERISGCSSRIHLVTGSGRWFSLLGIAYRKNLQYALRLAHWPALVGIGLAETELRTPTGTPWTG